MSVTKWEGSVAPMGTGDSRGKHIAHLSHQDSPYPHELQESWVGQEESTMYVEEQGWLPGVAKHLHLHTNVHGF